MDPLTKQSIHSSPIRRILVVDDQEFVRTILTRYLTSLGYEVDSAREREEAEALLNHRHYHAVIADLGLTAINAVEGLDLVTYARYRCPGTAVVVLTGNADPAVATETLRRGADAFLSKPAELEELGRTIGRLVRQ